MQKLYDFILNNDIMKYIHYYKCSTPLIIIKYPNEIKTTVYLLDYEQRWNDIESVLAGSIDILDQPLNMNPTYSREAGRQCDSCFSSDSFCEAFGIYICENCHYSFEKMVAHGVMEKYIPLNPLLGRPNLSIYVISDKLYIYNYYNYAGIRERYRIELDDGFDFDYRTIIITNPDQHYDCRGNELCLNCFKIKIYILWLDIKDCLVNITELNQDINSYIHKILLNNC